MNEQCEKNENNEPIQNPSHIPQKKKQQTNKNLNKILRKKSKQIDDIV